MGLRVTVLASGRGTNLQALLDAARQPGYPARVVQVISDNPEAPALQRARAVGVPAKALPFSSFPTPAAYHAALARALEESDPGLVALAGYLRRIPPDLVEAYRWRMMNIHPSLLPAFPGLRAQAQALRHGVKVSGATVHFVDEGLDTGPIILQEAVPVREDDTVETLSARILAVEHRLYPAAVRLFAEGRLVVEGRRVRIRGGGEILP